MKKLFLLATVVIGFTVASYAQVSDEATANAKITTALTINTSSDLNFGAIIPDVDGGTVTVSAAGVRSATGVVLTSGGGTITAAGFDLTGTGGSHFSVALPASAFTITRISGTETMTVDTWTSNPTVAAGGSLDSGGAGVLRVGGTLNVGANQAIGNYTNSLAGFQVTVQYD